jgi:hypothetical protein
MLFTSVRLYDFGSKNPLTFESDPNAGIIKDFAITYGPDSKKMWLTCGDGNIYSCEFSAGQKGKLMVQKKLEDQRKKK